MRWIAMQLCAAVLLVAAACEDEDAATDRGATPTLAVTATGAPPVTTAVAQRLRSLVPTADEVGAAFPDLAPFEEQPIGGPGQEYEHIGHLPVAGSGSLYRYPDENHLGYVSVASFDDANAASSAMAEMLAEEFGQSDVSTFEVAQREEAHGISLVAAPTCDILWPSDFLVLDRQKPHLSYLSTTWEPHSYRRSSMAYPQEPHAGLAASRMMLLQPVTGLGREAARRACARRCGGS